MTKKRVYIYRYLNRWAQSMFMFNIYNWKTFGQVFRFLIYFAYQPKIIYLKDDTASLKPRLNSTMNVLNCARLSDWVVLKFETGAQITDRTGNHSNRMEKARKMKKNFHRTKFLLSQRTTPNLFKSINFVYHTLWCKLILILSVWMYEQIIYWLLSHPTVRNLWKSSDWNYSGARHI